MDTLPVETTQDVLRIFDRIINWFFVFLLLFAVIYVILAAYNYLISEGDVEKRKKATKMITYASIAIAVGFLSRGIVFIVRQIVGG